jgi:hypothetical protein
MALAGVAGSGPLVVGRRENSCCKAAIPYLTMAVLTTPLYDRKDMSAGENGRPWTSLPYGGCRGE